MSGNDRRIGSIMQFISAVSAGDFEARLETTGADDELDTLIERINLGRGDADLLHPVAVDAREVEQRLAGGTDTP